MKGAASIQLVSNVMCIIEGTSRGGRRQLPDDCSPYSVPAGMSLAGVLTPL